MAITPCQLILRFGRGRWSIRRIGSGLFFDCEPFVYQSIASPGRHVAGKVPFGKALIHDEINESPGAHHESAETHELGFVDAAVFAHQIFEIDLVVFVSLDVPGHQHGYDSHYDDDQVHVMIGLHGAEYFFHFFSSIFLGS